MSRYLVGRFEDDAGGVLGASAASDPAIIFCDSVEGQNGLRFPKKVLKVKGAR
jgi:hypothetical protein